MNVRSAASRVVVLAATVSLLSFGPNARSASGALPTPRPPDTPPPAAPADTYETPGETTLVSYDAAGTQMSGAISPTISGDGRYVVFYAPYLIGTTNVGQILLRDRVQNVTRVVVRGRFVGQAVVVVVYVASPTISRDGKWVAYTSGPSNPNSIYLWNVATGQATQAVAVTGGSVDQPAIADGGRYVAFRTTAQLLSADGNAGPDIYVKDVQGGDNAYDLVSKPDPSWKLCYTTMNANPAISADGRYVAYDTTCAPDGPGSREVELRDRTAGKTTLISKDANGVRGKGDSTNPSISADGSVIAFESASSTIIPGDTNNTPDVFVWQAPGNALDRVSVSTEGAQGNGTSGEASISGNGRIVAFSSDSSTLVPGDATGPVAGGTSPRDIFVHDLVTGRTSRISFGLGPREASGSSLAPSVNKLGDAVAFQSTASNLVQVDVNKNVDIFVRDRLPTLTLAPNPTDFGTVTPGSTPAPRTVTVSNGGAGPAQVKSITFGGTGAAAFKMTAEDCTSAAVYPGDTCAISIAFTPGAVGSVDATVEVVDPASDAKASAKLTALVADYAIELSPQVGPPGLVVQVTGHGFTPGQPVDLSWQPGLTPKQLAPVVVAADGTFKAQMLVMSHDLSGPRKLVATTTVGGRRVKVEADFLVVEASTGPPRNNWVPLPSGWAPPFVDRP